MRHLLCGFAAIVVLTLAEPAARADKPAPPFSYKKLATNGEFVFVMLAPGTERGGWNEAFQKEIKQIRATYSKSGLYRINDPTKPLWTVDWYAFDVDVAPDGIHLVRHGPWATDFDDEAVSFFANGQLLRTYTIAELVDVRFLVSRSVSHFRWCKGQNLGGDLNYSLTTYDGNRFEFDVTTGEISFESRPVRGLLVAAVVAGVCVIGVVFWRRRRRAAAKR